MIAPLPVAQTAWKLMEMVSGQGSAAPKYRPNDELVTELVEVQYLRSKVTYSVQRKCSQLGLGGTQILGVTMMNTKFKKIVRELFLLTPTSHRTTYT